MSQYTMTTETTDADSHRDYKITYKSVYRTYVDKPKNVWFLGAHELTGVHVQRFTPFTIL